jgi:3-hydroxyisobutyrate dehydrogenase-like beta-hydroxyacid dehydrogenase
VQFSLGEDQIAVREMARSFAAEVFAPHAVGWDEAKHFPIAEMRQAAALMLKDLKLAREAVQSVHAHTALGAQATEIYETFESSGKGGCIVDFIRRH